jgi:hypothetical protein
MTKLNNVLDYAVKKPIQSLVFVGASYITFYLIRREIRKYKQGQKDVSGLNPYNWQKFLVNMDDVIRQKKLNPATDIADYNQTTLNKLAKDIYDALGLTDNFGAVKGVYQKFTNKYSFAKLVRTFEQTYKMDFRNWLRSGYYWNPAGGFSEAEINQLDNYIDSLPDIYILKK